MKFFLILTILAFANVSLAFPAINHRWELTPNSEGKLHLIDLKPFDEAVEPLFIPEQDMTFTLFTRSNPIIGQRIDVGNLASVQSSHFNPNHPTRVLIHGWTSHGADEFNTEITAAFVNRGNYNVISVDWSVGASSINYITSRNRVGPVGARTAHMIDFLHLHGYVRFPDLHFIGLSLGGHAVGHAGKSLTRGKVQVIESLDPAGPLFNLNDPDNRIDRNDAVYVETIITNGGSLGFMGALGHANFYPNFGRSQPGCGTDIGGLCSHVRSASLFAESISSGFTGHECLSFDEISNGVCTRTGRTARMGGSVPNLTLTGNFFLTTNAQSPFTQG